MHTQKHTQCGNDTCLHIRYTQREADKNTHTQSGKDVVMTHIPAQQAEWHRHFPAGGWELWSGGLKPPTGAGWPPGSWSAHLKTAHAYKVYVKTKERTKRLHCSCLTPSQFEMAVDAEHPLLFFSSYDYLHCRQHMHAKSTWKQRKEQKGCIVLVLHILSLK